MFLPLSLPLLPGGYSSDLVNNQANNVLYPPITSIDYTQFITSCHQTPAFKALVALFTQDLDQNRQTALNLPNLFNVDTAVGQQLDFIGKWVGLSRSILGINIGYLALDDTTYGLDAGTWDGQTLGGTSYTMSDTEYRIALYTKIALNHWDGTIPSIINALLIIAPNNTITLTNNFNLTFTVNISGTISPSIKTLIQNGYFDIRPCGVALNYTFI